MSGKAFKPGDTVYLDDGQQVDLISAAPEGYVIRPLYESEEGDDEPHFGSPRIVYSVYAEPPVAKYNSDIARLRQEQAALSEQVDSLRKDKYEFERDERGRKDRLRLHGQLANLDNFLAGKITHVVTHDTWGSEIGVQDIAKAVEGERSYSDLRLLEIRGQREGGNITWRIQDGHRSIVPCTSEAEAAALAGELIAAAFDAKRKGPHGLQAHSLDGLARSCARLKIAVPVDVQAVLDAKRAADAAEALRKAQIALDAAKSEAAKWPAPSPSSDRGGS